MGLWALGHQQPSFRALIGLERAMDRRRKWTRGEASFRVQKGPRCRDPPLDDGANERIRTADLRITSALLYQLSHVGISCG